MGLTTRIVLSGIEPWQSGMRFAEWLDWRAQYAGSRRRRYPIDQPVDEWRWWRWRQLASQQPQFWHWCFCFNILAWRCYMGHTSGRRHGDQRWYDGAKLTLSSCLCHLYADRPTADWLRHTGSLVIERCC